MPSSDLLNRATEASQPFQILWERGLVRGRVLEDGSSEPHPLGPYDTIVCPLLPTLNRPNRARLIARIHELLDDDGRAYLAVARGPQGGRSDVVLTLPSIHADETLEIYELCKDSDFADRTWDEPGRQQPAPEDHEFFVAPAGLA